MLKKSMIVVITTAFVLFACAAVGAANLNSITYSISGDSFEIDTLELEPEFRLDGGHPAQLNLAFDGDDFYFGAGMGLNMLRQDNLKMDLQLMLTSDVDGNNFGKAVGIAAATRNQELNFFWQTHYFIDSDLDDHAYYQGGVAYRLSPQSDLELSVANQYWDLDNDVIKLGLKFNM